MSHCMQGACTSLQLQEAGSPCTSPAPRGQEASSLFPDLKAFCKKGGGGDCLWVLGGVWGSPGGGRVVTGLERWGAAGEGGSDHFRLDLSRGTSPP